jgi:hypothetical protein
VTVCEVQLRGNALKIELQFLKAVFNFPAVESIDILLRSSKTIKFICRNIEKSEITLPRKVVTELKSHVKDYDRRSNPSWANRS